ncbi:MAG TPA: hypothetical protein VFH22_00630, partial [Rhodocyclaceae bacterium]|nr:hypothetical protein [Rhodocyclaceae bacterium]
LLDAEMNDRPMRRDGEALRGVGVEKLQVWRIERDGLACWVQCAATDAAEVRRRLQALPEVRQFAINS